MFQAEKGANSIAVQRGYENFVSLHWILIKIYYKYKGIEIIFQIMLVLCLVQDLKIYYSFFSGTRQHHQGFNLPADLRCISEVKEAYNDQTHLKMKDKLLKEKIDNETSKVMTYSVSNLTNTQTFNTTQS